jgi:hypothetical protein
VDELAAPDLPISTGVYTARLEKRAQNPETMTRPWLSAGSSGGPGDHLLVRDSTNRKAGTVLVLTCVVCLLLGLFVLVYLARDYRS